MPEILPLVSVIVRWSDHFVPLAVVPEESTVLVKLPPFAADLVALAPVVAVAAVFVLLLAGELAVVVPVLLELVPAALP